MYPRYNTGDKTADSAYETLNHPDGEEYPGANDWAKEYLRNKYGDDYYALNEDLMMDTNTEPVYEAERTKRELTEDEIIDRLDVLRQRIKAIYDEIVDLMEELEDA